MKIPFNKPFIVGKELFYIARAVMDGRLSGDGSFTRKCQDWMEETFGLSKVLLTHSCTAALEMAAILCRIKPGDQVLMPSFTFVSTANAFMRQGAEIKFIDIRPDTLNMDETLIERHITDKTRGVVPVHYAGVACEMDDILAIARHYGLSVVEDAAQAVNATYKGRYLGGLGDVGTYSFHETKNFISGEGGAVVINNDGLVERAEIIREKGTNRAKFFRGEVDKYTWVDIGSSYLPSELVAAFLYAQLEAADLITQKRLEIYQRYLQNLKELAQQEYVTLPFTPVHCRHNAHLFYIIVNGDTKTRDRLIHYLRGKGIQAIFHYVPLHTSRMGQTFGYSAGDLPLTEYYSERLLRLPCYFELEKTEQEYIIEQIHNFFKNS